jgi:transcriptional regulator with XRE-family HTH domain
MNMALKVAILQSGKSQLQIAAETGLDETVLSKFVRGWRTPTPEQAKAIAKAVKAKPSELFAEAS